MLYAPLNAVGWPEWYLRKSGSSYKTSNSDELATADGEGGGAGSSELNTTGTGTSTTSVNPLADSSGGTREAAQVPRCHCQRCADPVEGGGRIHAQAHNTHSDTPCHTHTHSDALSRDTQS